MFIFHHLISRYANSQYLSLMIYFGHWHRSDYKSICCEENWYFKSNQNRLCVALKGRFWANTKYSINLSFLSSPLLSIAPYCSLLLPDALYCSLLLLNALYCSLLLSIALYCSLLLSIALYCWPYASPRALHCSLLLLIAPYCSLLLPNALCYSPMLPVIPKCSLLLSIALYCSLISEFSSYLPVFYAAETFFASYRSTIPNTVSASSASCMFRTLGDAYGQQ
jgi:hypothetical protein